MTDAQEQRWRRLAEAGWVLDGRSVRELLARLDAERERADKAERLVHQIRSRCIDLSPSTVNGHADPRVWICRVCCRRGEFPGFDHAASCPVRALAASSTDDGEAAPC